MSRKYIPPEQIIRQRYNWFKEAERHKSVSLACKTFGISRKTFYKWRQRFRQARGDPNSLLDRPRRPYRSPRRVPKRMARRIIRIRKKTHLGPLADQELA